MSKRKRYVPRCGDIIRLSLDPRAGHEQGGRRPVLVLSPSDYNLPTGLAVVCPITNESKGYPFEVAIPENDLVSGVVLADHVKCLDWQARNADFICTVAEELVEEVVQRLLVLVDPQEDED
jgi:mRNA interferase MazF